MGSVTTTAAVNTSNSSAELSILRHLTTTTSAAAATTDAEGYSSNIAPVNMQQSPAINDEARRSGYDHLSTAHHYSSTISYEIVLDGGRVHAIAAAAQQQPAMNGDAAAEKLLYPNVFKNNDADDADDIIDGDDEENLDDADADAKKVLLNDDMNDASGSFPNEPNSGANNNKNNANNINRKRPARDPFPFGKCQVCGLDANGVHYGVESCEGCKGFYRRSVRIHAKFKCKSGGQCLGQVPLKCRLCRFQRCVQLGMMFNSTRMGRIPKHVKTQAKVYTTTPTTSSSSNDAAAKRIINEDDFKSMRIQSSSSAASIATNPSIVVHSSTSSAELAALIQHAAADTTKRLPSSNSTSVIRGKQQQQDLLQKAAAVSEAVDQQQQQQHRAYSKFISSASGVGGGGIVYDAGAASSSSTLQPLLHSSCYPNQVPGVIILEHHHNNNHRRILLPQALDVTAALNNSAAAAAAASQHATTAAATPLTSTMRQQQQHQYDKSMQINSSVTTGSAASSNNVLPASSALVARHSLNAALGLQQQQQQSTSMTMSPAAAAANSAMHFATTTTTTPISAVQRGHIQPPTLNISNITAATNTTTAAALSPPPNINVRHLLEQQIISLLQTISMQQANSNNNNIDSNNIVDAACNENIVVGAATTVAGASDSSSSAAAAAAILEHQQQLQQGLIAAHIRRIIESAIIATPQQVAPQYPTLMYTARSASSTGSESPSLMDTMTMTTETTPPPTTEAFGEQQQQPQNSELFIENIDADDAEFLSKKRSHSATNSTNMPVNNREPVRLHHSLPPLPLPPLAPSGAAALLNNSNNNSNNNTACVGTGAAPAVAAAARQHTTRSSNKSRAGSVSSHSSGSGGGNNNNNNSSSNGGNGNNNNNLDQESPSAKRMYDGVLAYLRESAQTVIQDPFRVYAYVVVEERERTLYQQYFKPQTMLSTLFTPDGTSGLQETAREVGRLLCNTTTCSSTPPPTQSSQEPQQQLPLKLAWTTLALGLRYAARKYYVNKLFIDCLHSGLPLRRWQQTPKDLNEGVCVVAAHFCQRMADFVDALPGVSQLPVGDRQLLTRSAMILGWASFKNLMFEQNGCYLLLGNGTRYNLEWMEYLIGPDVTSIICRVCTDMQSMQLTFAETCMFSALMILYEKQAGITAPDSIVQLKQHYMSALEHAMQVTRGVDEARIKLEHVRRCVAYCEELCMVCLPRIENYSFDRPFGRREVPRVLSEQFIDIVEKGPV